MRSPAVLIQLIEKSYTSHNKETYLAGPSYKLEFLTIGKRLNFSEKQSQSGIWGLEENHLGLLPQNRYASSLFSLEILEIQVSSCFCKEYENLKLWFIHFSFMILWIRLCYTLGGHALRHNDLLLLLILSRKDLRS
ncbi:hypothetical protein RDI58_010591 [Solanum bulbocastanum]|uniref:Uncharacterized protein n=1 Tax=Solanum bulbocastanum TaxID=147425 RepID=A0AAN8TPK1_SOLBU